jgi:hypothetical protein
MTESDAIPQWRRAEQCDDLHRYNGTPRHDGQWAVSSAPAEQRTSGTTWCTGAYSSSAALLRLRPVVPRQQLGAYGYFEIRAVRGRTTRDPDRQQGPWSDYQLGGTNRVTANGLCSTTGRGPITPLGSRISPAASTPAVPSRAWNITTLLPAAVGRSFNIAGGNVMLNNVLLITGRQERAHVDKHRQFNAVRSHDAIYKGATGGWSVINFDGGTLLAGGQHEFLEGPMPPCVDGGAVIDTPPRTSRSGRPCLGRPTTGSPPCSWAADLADSRGAVCANEAAAASGGRPGPLRLHDRQA